MNSLYTLGVRQTNSIQADLERLRNGDKSAALLGPCWLYSRRDIAVVFPIVLLIHKNDRADIRIPGCYAQNSG